MSQSFRLAAGGGGSKRPGWLRLLPQPLRRLGGRTAAPGAAAEESAWRRVPTINLLAVRQKRMGSALLLRVGLVLVVGVGGLLLLYLNVQRAASQKELQSVQRELSTAQAQLSTGQQELGGFRDQVSQLQGQLETAQQVYQQVTTGSADWGASLSALFQVRVSGVTFASVIAQPQGLVELTGVATDAQTMAKLQTQLQRSGNPFQLQGLRWEAAGNAVSFSATIKLAK